MCPVDVWAAWAPRGWAKGTRALSTGKMQAQSSRLGQKELSHSRRMTFRRATAVDVGIIDQTLDLFLVARELDAKRGRQLPPHLAKHVFRKRNDCN
jgi:hypothetical protein